MIKENDDYALIYEDISPNEDIMPILRQLEELSWKSLDILNGFWYEYVKTLPLVNPSIQAMLNAQYTFTNV